jgi:hypothetical protein
MTTSVVTTFYDVLGWIGAASVVVPYALVSVGRMAGTSAAYRALNIVGGVLLMLNTGYHHAWPSAVVNLVWIAIGLYAVAGSYRRAPARD